MKGPVECIMSLSCGEFHEKNDDDFSEYIWMGEELEDFDNKIKNECEDEFWEEYFIEMCFEEMLDEEDDEWFYPILDLDPATFARLQLNAQLARSNLNPEAPEFYPRSYLSSSDEDLSHEEDEQQQR